LGRFRSGSFTIAGTSYIPPKAELLNKLWTEMVAASIRIEGVYNQAIFVFLEMSKHQFFYDVNKRMGRFMMNGILLDQGYPAINVPAKRQQEFNTLMIQFYETGIHKNMTEFMLSCLDHKHIAIMSE
jgi:prophage maintenance system killer protein